MRWMTQDIGIIQWRARWRGDNSGWSWAGPASSRLLQRRVVEQLLDEVHVAEQHASAAVLPQTERVQSVTAEQSHTHTHTAGRPGQSDTHTDNAGLVCERRHGDVFHSGPQTWPWIPKSDLWSLKISRLNAALDPWSNRIGIPWWSMTEDLGSHWIHRLTKGRM